MHDDTFDPVSSVYTQSVVSVSTSPEKVLEVPAHTDSQSSAQCRVCLAIFRGLVHTLGEVLRLCVQLYDGLRVTSEHKCHDLTPDTKYRHQKSGL